MATREQRKRSVEQQLRTGPYENSSDHLILDFRHFEEAEAEELLEYLEMALVTAGKWEELAHGYRRELSKTGRALRALDEEFMNSSFTGKLLTDD